MTCVNNLLLILAMMVLSNGGIPLFDNKNKSSESTESSVKVEPKVETVVDSSKSSKGKRSGQKVRKVKKIKKKIKSKPSTKKNILNFDMSDVNNGINLMDLSEEDLDRGMEIITRTKKYMDKEERNILIKLESVLDLVKGIKKLNDINILSEKDESEFFRSMDEDDKKNMMIKEIIEVFPEKKKQSVEKALEMKKMIDLFAELFLPDEEGSGGFSLSSLADINNLGSISNLKLLGNLLRGLEDSEEEDKSKEYEYIEVEDDDAYEMYEEVEEDNKDDDKYIQQYNEYMEENKVISNNKKYNKNRKNRKTKNKKTKEIH